MSKTTHTNFFLLLLGLALIVGFILLRPFLSAVLVGGVLAAVFYPIYLFFLRFLRFRGVSAMLTLLLVFFVVFIPLFFIGQRVAEEAGSVYTYVASNGNVEKLFARGSEMASRYFPGIKIEAPTVEINGYLKQVFLKIVENIGPIFSGVLRIALHIVLTFLTLYYLLKDGRILREKLTQLSPLKKIEDEKILKTIQTAVTSIVRGSLVIGVIQGVLAGVGFFIFGVPNPALWGGVAIMAALVPGVGTALVIVPAVLFLAIMGNPINALLLLLWGATVVGLIDNILRTYLIGRDTKMHPLLVLLSVLGGLVVFGPVGFLIGPLFLSFLLALLEIYPSIVEQNRKE
ncbi:MAG: AI-2E family transporter [Nanoarchaeota archaeon]|nr:AI-2E family transporter [Nanoarchaeota archaeon]